MSLAPTSAKAELENDAGIKRQPLAKMNSATQLNRVDPNIENYKKAGLNDEQITNISASIKNLEQKETAIQSNKEITQEEKQGWLDILEKDKQAILKKNMDAVTYKKYIQLTQADQKAKFVKSTATPQ